jgi:hypothetical protein
MVRRIFLLLLVTGLAACASSDDGEPAKPVELPASIAAQVRSMYPDRVVVACETTITPEGRTHEIDLRQDRRKVNLVMDDSGTVLYERAELLASEVPYAILGTVRKEFPEARIPLVIRRRNHSSIHYEVRLVQPSGIRSHVEINPAGMIIEDIDGEGVPAGR